MLEREEYIEQAYFFRVLRERLLENIPTQEILISLPEELLSTTKMPMAVEYLSAELKHTGLMGNGFARLSHYFTPFQVFIVRQSEEEKRKFPSESCWLVLEREALYRAEQPTYAGLFVYQFETICRNRLGYDEGLRAMQEDPFFPLEWQQYFEMIRKQVGLVDFSELVYLRSEAYVESMRRQSPNYQASLPPLLGSKEGRIAKASIGRDPLFLFSALQRQLGYPQVPRPKIQDDAHKKFLQMQVKIRELEARVNLLESEARGKIDWSQFKPEILKDIKDD